MSFQLLEVFLDLASDQVLDSLSPLDVHHLASCHASVDALIEKRRQQAQQCVTNHNAIRARYLVDQARLAVQDEPEVLRILQLAKTQFAATFRKFAELAKRKKLSQAVVDQVAPEFECKTDWYSIKLLPSNAVLLRLTMMGLEVALHATKECGVHAMIFDNGKRHDTEMHPSWVGATSLGVALIELIGIPVNNIHASTTSEKCLVEVLATDDLPIYDGRNDEAINRQHFRDDYDDMDCKHT